MTYQFPAAAWRPSTKPSARPTATLDQNEFAATIAEALSGPVEARRKPNPRSAADMVAQLETQAREILDLAGEAGTVPGFRIFTTYRHFREKLADFQSFCGVIENYLGRLAGARRPELQDRLYALWGAIYRPALAALTGFFSALERDGIMPLGAREVLEAEMLALETMCGIMADPRFGGHSADLIDHTKRLITRVGALADRAHSLPELVDTRAA